MQNRDGAPRDDGGLPAEAQGLVARIEALLGQAEPLLAQGGSDEAAFALRETERRYLPDTLRAYLDVPPARRDAAARAMLVEQLGVLERATAQRLAALAEGAQTALAANGAFLTERFGSLESLPEAPPVDPEHAVAATLVRTVLERIERDAGPEPQRLLDAAGAAFTSAFPALAGARRGGLLGRGPVEELWITVPRRDDQLQYALRRAPYGIEATCTRVVRGVRLRTQACDVPEWTQGLIEDLGAYVARERSARDALSRLFKENR